MGHGLGHGSTFFALGQKFRFELCIFWVRSGQEILTRFAMSSYYKQPATQTQYVKDSVLTLQMNTQPHKKFLISNKNSLIKKETAKYTGGIQRWTNQERTLQKSSKSKIEEKGWFLHTENQSNKVLKNRSLMSSKERSLSSKHLLFLFFQMHHNKQWGTTIHISPLRWWPNRPC